MIWEYKVKSWKRVPMHSVERNIEVDLNALGALGWELVALSRGESGQGGLWGKCDVVTAVLRRVQA